MKLQVMFVVGLLCVTGCKSKLFEDKPKVGNIVIINIGDVDRVKIARALDIINSSRPKVIALDVLFSNVRDTAGDFALIASLEQTKKLVMAIKLGKSKTFPFVFNSVEGTLPEFYSNARLGYVNVMIREMRQPVTWISLYEDIGDDRYYHFSVQTAFAYDSLTTIDFLNRNFQNIEINYKGNKEVFETISIYDVLNGSVLNSAIEDKIVLLGYIGTGENLQEEVDEDMFVTPLNQNLKNPSPDMYGVIYLANVINQILTSPVANIARSGTTGPFTYISGSIGEGHVK